METMDFMKRAWATFKVPTAFTPTMDVDELDKRIADLRTVEQWLTMNLGLLRNTIQAMELQRNTLATLQKMASNFEEATRMRPADDEPAATSWPSMVRSRADEGASATRTEPRRVDSGDADESQSAPMPAFPMSPFALMNAFPFLMPPGMGVPSPVVSTDGDQVNDSGEGGEEPAGGHALSGGNPAPATAGTESGFAAGDIDESNVDASAPRSDEDRAGQDSEAKAASAGGGAAAAGPGATTGGADPIAWWRMLQSSFEQIAAAATAHPVSPFAATAEQGDPAGQTASAATKGRARSERDAAASPGAKRPAATRGAAAKSAVTKGATTRSASAKGRAAKGGTARSSDTAGDATPTRGSGRRGSR